MSWVVQCQPAGDLAVHCSEKPPPPHALPANRDEAAQKNVGTLGGFEMGLEMQTALQHHIRLLGTGRQSK